MADAEITMMPAQLAHKIIMATAMRGGLQDGSAELELLHREYDLLAPKNRKAVRQAFAYFIEVMDRPARRELFCFLWEKSGHPWDIPVTMTTIRG